MYSNSKPPESVGDLLGRYSEGISKASLRTLGVRLSEEDHILLDMIAAHYGVPKATFARDLMSAALSEAMSSMRFENPEDEAEFGARYDERIMNLPAEMVRRLKAKFVELRVGEVQHSPGPEATGSAAG